MAKCNVCQKDNPVGVEYCEDCGAALATTATPIPAPPPQPGPDSGSAVAPSPAVDLAPMAPLPPPVVLGATVRYRLQAKRYGVVSTTEEVPLAGERLIVGRFDSETGPVDVDLGASPDAATISRHHAELSRNGEGKWTVRDLGSTNGVFVKAATDSGFGPRLGEPRTLSDGDELAFGNARFIFRAGD